ncbi:hypothetical protein AURANDRAFT_59495 [Aureococcus anophagefferens]|nr:hypothetical protein AURANDRAFT_59495 [Aureococcus anophagefferens]EGB04507.1 hypothetical protein AURANDRAFT_59495 [Aureococcus anophagefferens]|eukprot:XP_009040761.1 hypothetical protein AURANDRAFT_59495 [Aureococcus anophagefferens]
MIARRFGGAQQSRTGGKGSVRRKKKTMHKTATSDDKKLGSTLKKLGVTNIPAIEEVNLFTSDGKVVHFSNPKVQASIAANTYVVSGPNETKQLTELLPGIMNQLGPDNIDHLKQIADKMSYSNRAPSASSKDDEIDDDEVPDLIENFEDVSKL